MNNKENVIHTDTDTHTQNGISNPTVAKKEILPFVTTWIQLKSTVVK